MPETKGLGFIPTGVIDEIIRSGKYALLFSLIKAFRDGLVYGTKVRAPHATVLELVWGSGPPRNIPGKVLRITATHAFGLGFASVIFTLVTRLLRTLQEVAKGTADSPSLTVQRTYSSTWWHHSLAGFLIGYLAWGNISNKVHQQMLIYVVSRLMVALLNLYSHRVGYHATPHHYRLFSGAMWAMLMTILFMSPGSLQVNMRKSLEYVFLESNRFSSIRELIGRCGE